MTTNNNEKMHHPAPLIAARGKGGLSHTSKFWIECCIALNGFDNVIAELRKNPDLPSNIRSNFPTADEEVPGWLDDLPMTDAETIKLHLESLCVQ